MSFRLPRIVLIAAILALSLSTHAATPRRPRANNINPTTPDPQSLRLAVQDLIQTFGSQYPKGSEFLARLANIEKSDAPDAEITAQLETLRRDALVANPLLNFDRLLLVKRNPKQMGLPQNWQGNCALPRHGYENEIAVLSPVSPTGKLTTFYKPDSSKFVGDVRLNFDADKLLFSSLGFRDRWHIFEISADGQNSRQLTPDATDYDNYDATYLPDGRIIFDSTAVFHGVPCVGGGDRVANLFRMDADGKNIRQLCFDQDHDWCPTVLNDGRILYTRWEYSDSPHYFTRLLFHMNPDGTGQSEFYGSNSYWPNSIFYARPIPGHPSKLVAVISGHHGVPRMGELIVFDPAKAKHEASGVVQRIPGYRKPVDATIADGLVDASWPKFLHPFPLSDKYFLVSMQPTPQSNWGIYLVDTFDNAVLLCEQPGYAMLEPVPFRKTPRPPVIPDKTKSNTREATIYLADVYSGPGLAGVPRGSVKKLRIFEFHYAYPNMGGHIHVAVDGPWDVHRIVGTVPVNDDGSAAFKVPANTPLAVQPLDADGKALQVMRSWFTAMPGETLSCVGCHERQSDAPAAKLNQAMYKPPVAITPWYGPTRGFSFKREVQPVLDKHCISCHNNQPRTDNKTLADFTSKPNNGWRNFTPSYLALHPYVRRPGPESDYRLQFPLAWHADTSELVQLLQKGHYNVNLDSESWDRLVTWIDLNVPDHGTWGEHAKVPNNFRQRRIETRTQFADRPEDPEAIPQADPPLANLPAGATAGLSASAPQAVTKINLANWPFTPEEAQKRQKSAGIPPTLKIPLSADLNIELTLIPAGSFIMGDPAGYPDEQPTSAVKIEKPFYMARFETTNAQYALFNPAHDSGYISVFNKDQSNRGEPADRPKQPVIRVSFTETLAYCNWLSQRTGRRFTLPTEAQWEYAARAGSNTALSFGDLNTDFAKYANLADSQLLHLCRGDSPKWIPAIAAVNDNSCVTCDVGRYQPNPFGLNDIHGNVWEWTSSTYASYPYKDTTSDTLTPKSRKVIRGGSFYDRPIRSRSAMRLAYPSWQKTFNVGFRVICDAPPPSVTSATPQ